MCGLVGVFQTESGEASNESTVISICWEVSLAALRGINDVKLCSVMGRLGASPAGAWLGNIRPSFECRQNSSDVAAKPEPLDKNQSIN
jgi:hypothetical protein